MGAKSNKIDVSNVSLEVAKEEDLPIFQKKLQEAFAVAVAEQYGNENNGPIPSDEDVQQSFHASGAVIYYVLSNGIKIGGAVVILDEKTQHNSLDLFFISPEYHSRGLGLMAWKAIEAKYPNTKVWVTVTPYFEKRNIHFYVNKCGFHIVEFYNEHNPDPHISSDQNSEFPTSIEDGLFRFEKMMKLNHSVSSVNFLKVLAGFKEKIKARGRTVE